MEKYKVLRQIGFFSACSIGDFDDPADATAFAELSKKSDEVNNCTVSTKYIVVKVIDTIDVDTCF